MTSIDTSLDGYVEQEKQENQKKQEQQSPLEQMPALKQQKKYAEPEFILQPVSFNHMLRIEGRETDLPDAPKEEMECPAVPDMKKVEEDYNSIDYQMLAFNLWKSKARELF